MAYGDIETRRRLTRDELREIQRRRRDDEDIKRLLWYIFELRQVAVRADVAAHALNGKSEIPSYYDRLMLLPLRQLLANEPAVLENRKTLDKKSRIY